MTDRESRERAREAARRRPVVYVDAAQRRGATLALAVVAAGVKASARDAAEGE